MSGAFSYVCSSLVLVPNLLRAPGGACRPKSAAEEEEATPILAQIF